MIFLHDKVTVAFSKKPYNMSFVHGEGASLALNNRKSFLSGVGIDYRDLVCAKQVHGDRIKIVEKSDIGKGAQSYDTAVADTDAFITNVGGLPLAVLTADCLSVFLYDSRNFVIGIVHAGWKGTSKKITAKTLDLMHCKFDTDPAHVYAGFGPVIRDCCYEVGEEFKGYFDNGLISHDDKYYLDLIAINREQLSVSGVKKERIYDPKICTSCSNNEFFSYRKESSACGRILSVIKLN